MLDNGGQTRRRDQLTRNAAAFWQRTVPIVNRKRGFSKTLRPIASIISGLAGNQPRGLKISTQRVATGEKETLAHEFECVLKPDNDRVEIPSESRDGNDDYDYDDGDDDDDVWPQWVCMSVTVNDTAACRDDLVSSAVWRA